ncbi:MAG: hypothetical protein ABSC02_03010 [Acidobacteriota bacterium]
MRALCVAIMILCRWGFGGPLAAQEIDRLLAAVNGKVITEGDLSISRSLNSLILLGRSETNPTRAQELSRLIDLELIRQEMESFPFGQADQSSIQSEVEKQRSALMTVYAEIGGLPALLRRLGLQEDELVSYLRLRVHVTRFMDLRFRPFVTGVKEDEVDAKVNAALDQWIQNIRSHSHIELFDAGAHSAEKKRP